MKQEIVRQSEIKLVGISARTSNAAEFNPATAKIAATIQKYISEATYDKLPNRKTPGKTYCVYTEYESDYTGEYTYFIGEEVEFSTDVPKGLDTITVPAQLYAKFTTESGAMPNICVNAWVDIWKMSSKELSGDREYLADFEVYDERALDPANTVLDIYIGIKQ